MAHRKSEQDRADIYTYHAPSEAGIQRHAELSRAFTELDRIVDTICPDGREKAIVLTHLEEAKFNASAAVARNPVTR